ncbi:1-phosphatidylinositol 4,5-bisphosphate phosphodiesterase eta-1 [Toxocara canis]|uniref:Phosphoinositide phospholipase C n=1 Tax=Toxocara canis TaxID=6265 RepID=A0A0B2V1W8_TOXCA|nr:1-phosphatidylinositol 4,5-bisphosphate phosphodiesterase eta-1 [Toxocara canis]
MCFSVILAHRRFLHKSLDFVAQDNKSKRVIVNALQYLIEKKNKERMHFDERRWLVENFKRADVNNNGKLSFNEVWKLLKRLNLQISQDYAMAMFMDADTKKTETSVGDRVLDQDEFLAFFERLTHRPDLEHALRLFSSIDDSALTVNDLREFLTNEQHFTDVDAKKAESIIETYETPNHDNHKGKLLGAIGFRRLLQSRWGNITKPGHESVFQNMDHPLSHYYVNSSHNTYLTGLQMKGEATVEGYISALKKGARLLELDIFDNDHGEPCITHKRTLITSITLRNALKAIDQYAFVSNPYPVILTIENHVGLPQQKAMVRIFNEVLGDKIYIRPENAAVTQLPSPNALKRKYLLRGKKLPTETGRDRQLDQDDDESPEQPREKPDKIQLHPDFSRLISLPSVKISSNIYQDVLGDKIYIRPENAAVTQLPSPNALKRKYLLRGKKLPTETGRDRQLDQDDDESPEQPREKPDKIQLHPDFSRLISLPSVKISSNIYQDVKEHPMDGSASLSETKVQSLMEGGTSLAVYTASRFVKSYPKGLRQDSSNMDPIPSWICGIQSVAMNMQTSGEYLDLVSGLFRINGNCGYVLKPDCLLQGLDPRLPEVSERVRTVLSVGIISGQYLPKPTPGHDVIDPYVTVEIFGIPADAQKFRTKTIADNGFNPQWNETFRMGLRCPELALLRLCVKDFDSTSANDFVGEYTIPVKSIRGGYSHVRLNTGYGHTVDESASLLVRVAFDD